MTQNHKIIKEAAKKLLIISYLIACALTALAGDLLSLQGNVDQSGTPVSSGGLVMEIWDGPDPTNSNLVYNSSENFTGNGNISGGKFDIVLGSVGDELNLEYGRVYYLDFFVNSRNLNFSGAERQPFMSSVGVINSSFIKPTDNYTMDNLLIAKTLNVNGVVEAYDVLVNGSSVLFSESDPVFVNENGSFWVAALDKFNSTYDLWAYNQTIPAMAYADSISGSNTYNATYDSLTIWGYNQTDAAIIWIGEQNYLTNTDYTKIALTNQTNTFTTGQTIDNTTAITTAYLNISDGQTPKLIVDPAGRVGIGTTNPSQKLQITNGSVYVTGEYGSETLSETDFTTHAKWDTIGDFDDTGGTALYTHNTGTGTLTQTSANQANASVGSKRYEFTYTVSELTREGTLEAQITTAFASEATALSLSEGTHTTSFITAASPEDFVISVTSDTPGDTFTLDNFSLKRVIGGDVIAVEGLITGGGATGIKVTSTGNVGIGTTAPRSNLDVSGGSWSSTEGSIKGVISIGTSTGNSMNQIVTYQSAAENDFLGLAFKIHDSSDHTALPTTKMVINHLGNVGIGTTEPQLKLDVRGTTFISGNVGIGTTSPSGKLHINGTTNPLVNITNGTNDFMYINNAGQIVIGNPDAPTNDTMLLTIAGGDLNVSGSIYYGGSQLTSSPFVVQSAEGEPIPVCMKNAIGIWVGCMPDENNDWACAPNRECDKKVLRLEATWKLKSEGASDEEVNRKVGSIRQKFEQGKDLKTIKSEVRAEVGELQVLDEIDDTQANDKAFGVQSQSPSADVTGDIINLKTQNDALRNEINALKEEVNALKALLKQNQEQRSEQQWSGEPIIEPSLEPADINNTGINDTDHTVVPTEQPTEGRFSITGASIWYLFSSGNGRQT